MEQEHGHAAGHKAPNYMAIFYWLAGMTVVEVGYATWMHGHFAPLVIGLVLMAGTKALLVALYFMHLKFERKSLGIIVGSTLILGVILVSVGLAEHFLPRP